MLVPMLAPIITGIEFRIGRAFFKIILIIKDFLLNGVYFCEKKIPFVFDPTMATTIEVDVEEDCTTTVKSIPITSPAMGFCVDSRTILEASFPKDCNKLRLLYEESMFV